MSKIRWNSGLVLAAAAVFGLSALAHAQRTTGDITGTVTDSTGGVLPGVTVTAVCAETRFTRTAVTDGTGGFRLPELPICAYKVTTDLQGFKTVSRDALVTPNAVAKVDFKLEVGTQSETVNVEGVSPVIEFSDKLNNRVDAQRIEAMPLSGRDFNSLLNVMPGRPAPARRRLPGRQRQRRAHLVEQLHDRRDLEQRSLLRRHACSTQTGVVGMPATLVPTDAIGDFTVQQTPSAEFGVKGGAAINIVMKSGGNVPHGTGYYFRHDDWIDSPNFFDERAAQKAARTPVRRRSRTSSTAARSAARSRRTRRSSSATTKASASP